MSKANPLAGLIGYGDSDESDDEQVKKTVAPTTSSPAVVVPPQAPVASGSAVATVPPGIHPAPVPYCPWSACYDEGTGFTYYWNQQTNAVTWEAPSEYLLAVKIAQQHMSRSGSAEVSAEEWLLYQQALAEKENAQNKAKVKPATSNKKESIQPSNDKNSKAVKRRWTSDDDPIKIELITSYHNSDSESNDEESPVKPVLPKTPTVQTKKIPNEKVKLPTKKAKKATVEYGPSLPPNLEYTIPIGPEMPPHLISDIKPKSPEIKIQNNIVEHEEAKSSPKVNDEDIQDDDILLKRLKDKAKLLEKLGGELPTELQKIIEDETLSRTASPKIVEENSRDSKIDTNIDDLLDEIEKKELPKVKSKGKDNVISNPSSQNNSQRNSPKSTNGDCTPPLDENMKPLFPSSKNIDESALFPSAVNIVDEKKDVGNDDKEITEPVAEKKTGNMYLMDTNEPIENTSRKKLRISNSVLPERKKAEPMVTPAYTTKYSQHIEGFSSERTGLGFTKEDDSETITKNTISYGSGLLFTKGEVLNEDKKDEDLDDLTDLVEAKLKYLSSLQPTAVSPVQEMLIQMQTLGVAFRRGALSARYWRGWSSSAAATLAAHEAAAAPRPWRAVFLRSEGRYKYRRDDGFEQFEYPAMADTDMEICTTPPHPGAAASEDAPPPPPPPPESPPTPPPPVWDPPPPGTDDPPPPPPPVVAQDPPKKPEKKQEIGDALMSFYNDIAELEKSAPAPPPGAPPPPSEVSPRPVNPPLPPDGDEKKDVKKKKSKVKISASIGRKHKTVSSLVAKWQQVAEEINSD